MSNFLHITNGDSAVDVLKRAGVEGTILPWRDVLHDGPVPDGLELAELSKVRAKYIASEGWGEYETVLSGFRQRDEILERSHEFDQVTLWFEHDLYDQLQLIQILDWFNGHPDTLPKLTLIQTDDYLGMADTAKVQEFLKLEQPVNRQQTALATLAWAAFRSPCPTAWAQLLSTDTSALPHLHAAFIRLLEELPSSKTRLPRTEESALSLIASGEHHPGRLFGAWSKTEDPMFMGDWSFFKRLMDCLNCKSALIKQSAGEALDYRPRPDQHLELTEHGHQVLKGEAKATLFNSKPRWIGGVKLTENSLWLWDSNNNTIQQA